MDSLSPYLSILPQYLFVLSLKFWISSHYWVFICSCLLHCVFFPIRTNGLGLLFLCQRHYSHKSHCVHGSGPSNAFKSLLYVNFIARCAYRRPININHLQRKNVSDFFLIFWFLNRKSAFNRHRQLKRLWYTEDKENGEGWKE